MKKIIKEIISYLHLRIFMAPVNSASILMYHSIGENGLFFSVRQEDFEKQMKYLKENNFNIISINTLNDYLVKGDIPSNTVCLTFDDGHLDNFEIVFPILKKYNFPATIFVNTNFMGKEIEKRGIKSKIFGWEESKIMEDSGLIDIEPHTMNHIKLHKSPDSEIEKEIIGSKNEIEKILNKKCIFFAYPSGRYTQNVVEIIKKNEFKLAFTVNKGLVIAGDNPLLLNRNSVDSGVGPHQFSKIALSGRL